MITDRNSFLWHFIIIIYASWFRVALDSKHASSQRLYMMMMLDGIIVCTHLHYYNFSFKEFWLCWRFN